MSPPSGAAPDPSPTRATSTTAPRVRWRRLSFGVGVFAAAVSGLALLGADLRGGALGQGADPETLWTAGIPFERFLADADRRRAQWHRVHERSAVTPAELDRAGALSGRYRLLVVAEDWCGDSVYTVPYLARLADRAERLELRVVDSEAGAAVMDRHPTPDGRTATPTVLLLDAAGREVATWVERPSELQDWFLANPEGLDDRELHVRRDAWYEEDRGRSTVDEVLALLEGADSGWRLTGQRSGTEALLQALDPVSEHVVWVSGHQGTWGLTRDGGDTWETHVLPGAEELQFRDVEALNERTAWLLSAGPGDASRIYHTDDGGDTWRLQFRNERPEAFFDCLAFWNERRGLAFSDAVDGEFVILRTEDGERWVRVDPGRIPDALPGEGSFAASGTCVTTGPDGLAWIGTGNGVRARVLRTDDHGHTWSVADTPIAGGEGAGIASVAFRDAALGVAAGGALHASDDFQDAVALSDDGGLTWSLVDAPPFPGAVYGGAWTPAGRTLAIAGPGGLAASADPGTSWTALDRRDHWAVAFASEQVGWAVGPRGRITRLSRDRADARGERR